jgi:hypothetical protein
MDEQETHPGENEAPAEILLPEPSPPARSDMLTARLAQELAAGLMTPQEIAAGFNIAIDQLKQIIQQPGFREIYKEAKAAWGGGLNAKERTQAKADLAVEDGLLAMVGIVNDPTAGKGAQIDAFKQLTAVSSHAAKNQAAGGESAGEKFVLNITLASGEKQETVTIEAIPEDVDPEQENKL